MLHSQVAMLHIIDWNVWYTCVKQRDSISLGYPNIEKIVKNAACSIGSTSEEDISGLQRIYYFEGVEKLL